APGASWRRRRAQSRCTRRYGLAHRVPRPRRLVATTSARAPRPLAPSTRRRVHDGHDVHAVRRGERCTGAATSSGEAPRSRGASPRQRRPRTTSLTERRRRSAADASQDGGAGIARWATVGHRELCGSARALVVYWWVLFARALARRLHRCTRGVAR